MSTLRKLGLTALVALATAALAACNGDVHGSVSVGVGYGYGYGYGYSGYYGPWYPPPTVVVPPGGQPGGPGGPGGPGVRPPVSTLPAPGQLPSSRPSAPRPSSMSRPMSRPAPRAMGGRR